MAGRDLVVLGRIGGVYGIKGWLKVWSFTGPMDAILDYPVWQIATATGWQSCRIDVGRRHGKGLIVHLPGCDDPETARRFVQAEIAVARTELPDPGPDEYYWAELEGMQVYARRDDGSRTLIGTVDHLFETGANDVLVVQGCTGSIDTRERLIPWVPDEVIVDVDRVRREMLVDWDPDF
ncbi:MAG TPA: ribosome maturation factor RimM [Pseudomonadales bacterium]|nr:ribosome maturation factor RimM [Pseudomonadales bacterium]